MQSNAKLGQKVKKSDLRFAIRLIMTAMRVMQPREIYREKLRIVKLTIKETAARLKKDPSTLYRWRKQKGKLKPSYDGGGQPFYPAHEVDAYLQTTK